MCQPQQGLLTKQLKMQYKEPESLNPRCIQILNYLFFWKAGLEQHFSSLTTSQVYPVSPQDYFKMYLI